MIAYRLYLGSRNSRRFFPPRDRELLETILSRQFEGWSVFDAVGFWKNHKEESKVITLFVPSTRRGRQKVEAAAKSLRSAFRQYNIMLEHGSRVTDTKP